jgi:hypothetical protein
MAKKQKAKPKAVATAEAAAAPAPAPAPVAAAAACKLRRVIDSPDFEAMTGETLTLFTHDHIGMVLIAKAEYGGQQLVPAGTAVSKITFKVQANRNTLKMVFVFSASLMGEGELREDCGGGSSQFLRALNGDEPLQLMRIIGK